MYVSKEGNIIHNRQLFGQEKTQNEHRQRRPEKHKQEQGLKYSEELWRTVSFFTKLHKVYLMHFKSKTFPAPFSRFAFFV